MIMDPERAAALDLRDAAIDAEIDRIARELCDDPEGLLDWLDCEAMSLMDITLTHPVTGVRRSANTMLLRAALHSERVGPVSLGWVMEQIQQWLVRRPKIIKEATDRVDAESAPGRSAP